MCGYRLSDHGWKVAPPSRLCFEAALRRAASRKEFTLEFQPLGDLVQGTVTMVEALLRWDHPQLGAVPPAEFVPFLEATGLIHQVGGWVLERACEQLRTWRLEHGWNWRLAVNLSPAQLQQENLPSKLQEILAANSLPPQALTLDLPVRALEEKTGKWRTTLNGLADLGVLLALDDFGTGTASLQDLKSLPLHALKIDRGLVRGIPRDRDEAAIASAILDLGKSLRLPTVAKGVENREQMAFLHVLNCSHFQGFLFAKPMPADKLGAWAADTAFSRQTD